MKLKAVKITQPLDLSEFHEAYAGEVLDVWVNPPADVKQKRGDLQVESTKRQMQVQRLKSLPVPKESAEFVQWQNDLIAASEEFITWAEKVFIPGLDAWFAALWSSQDDGQWSAEDVLQQREADEGFMNWLRLRTMEMIAEHASGRKKNLTPRSTT